MRYPIFPFFASILDPVLFAVVNIFDKYCVSERSKDVFAFSILSGFGNILIFCLCTPFLHWSIYSIDTLTWAILSGILSGLQIYVYFWIMQKHDASSVVNLVYLFPIAVAILSAIFLGENLGLIGYIGMIISSIGALAISGNIAKQSVRGLSFIMIGIAIILTALVVFISDIAAETLPLIDVLMVNYLVAGIVLVSGIMWPGAYRRVRKEARLFKLALFSEGLTLAATTVWFFALAGLQATFVSVMNSFQPLAVLGMEYFIHKKRKMMVKDYDWKTKVIATSLIVVGITLVIFS